MKKYWLLAGILLCAISTVIAQNWSPKTTGWIKTTGAEIEADKTSYLNKTIVIWGTILDPGPSSAYFPFQFSERPPTAVFRSSDKRLLAYLRYDNIPELFTYYIRKGAISKGDKISLVANVDEYPQLIWDPFIEWLLFGSNPPTAASFTVYEWYTW